MDFIVFWYFPSVCTFHILSFPNYHRDCSGLYSSDYIHFSFLIFALKEMLQIVLLFHPVGMLMSLFGCIITIITTNTKLMNEPPFGVILIKHTKLIKISRIKSEKDLPILSV